MQPTNPNAHTYVHGTEVETHGYAVTQNTFLQKFSQKHLRCLGSRLVTLAAGERD